MGWMLGGCTSNRAERDGFARGWSRLLEGGEWKRLKIMVAVLALVLFAAVPAMANTVTAEVGNVTAEAESVFLGNDTATAAVGDLEATAESSFLWFDEDDFVIWWFDD
jgi:hypothetical protein